MGRLAGSGPAGAVVEPETGQADRANRSDFWTCTVGIGEILSLKENAKTGPAAKNKVAMVMVYRIENSSNAAIVRSS
uniref:hypothetical protein n=1 Tax=Neorhizobium sp. EC2-8 TaxID=3129230 RepID=UPI003100EAAD